MHRSIQFGILEFQDKLMNVILELMFFQNFPHCILHACNHQLHEFSRDVIHIIGYVPLELHFKMMSRMLRMCMSFTLTAHPSYAFVTFGSLPLHKLCSDSLNVIGWIRKIPKLLCLEKPNIFVLILLPKCYQN